MKRKRIAPLLIAGLAVFLGAAFGLNLWPFHHVNRTTSATNPCINNLRQLDGAIQQWALEHHKQPGDRVTMEDIKPYLGTRSPRPCQDGGSYNVSVVGALPTCSIGNPSFLQRVHNYLAGDENMPDRHRMQ
jgi:hypothetical protein